MTVAALSAPQPERAVWRTAKYRAEDLQVGDVTRNSFGKWSRVVKVTTKEGSLYLDIRFDTGDTLGIRDVALVDVQEVKPS